MDVRVFGWALALSAGLVSALYVRWLRFGINLADEGYLWHGARQVRSGAIPIRDFRAYDPGRYYWSALWLRLLGDDLLSVRIASLAARTLALAMGLTAVRLASETWLPVIPAGLLLAAWMFPPHRQIDALAAQAATLGAVVVATAPAPATLFSSGAAIGLCLLVGLNHGLYAAAGSLIVIGVLVLKGQGPALATSATWYTAGVAAGCLPYLALLVLVPGLGRSYWQRKLVPMIRRRSTNLNLPIPWPWRPTPRSWQHLAGWTPVIAKAAFTIMPISMAAAVAVALVVGPRTAGQWAVTAASAVGLGYAHHAWSRADFPHLTQGSGPFLVALSAALAQLPFGWVAIALLAAMSLRHVYLPLEGTESWPASGTRFGRFQTGRTSLRLREDEAVWFANVRSLVDRYSRPGDPVLFVPFLVTLYPLLDRRPAVYDVFCVYPATTEEEAAMIREIRSAGARLALVDESQLDGREELRFSRTHPRVWQLLHEELQPVNTDGLLPPHQHLFVNPIPADAGLRPTAPC